jgi:hypothetical protein
MIERPEHIESLRLIKFGLRQEILEAFAPLKIADLTKATGLHQTDIGYLRTDNKLNRFSVDRLLLILILLGRQPAIEMRKPARAAE